MEGVNELPNYSVWAHSSPRGGEYAYSNMAANSFTGLFFDSFAKSHLLQNAVGWEQRPIL